MFFSVLIPVYKTEPFLRECLSSVLQQTFDDYEIVLLDDGSPDNCGAICDEYVQTYPNRIRVIHKQNEGLMMTRRRGFRDAKGSYFICLDSDDFLYDSRALEKIHNVIVNEKCDLVLYDYIHGGSEKQHDRSISLFNYPSGYVFPEKGLVYERLLTSNQMNNIWLKCPHRSIVDIDTDYSVFQKEICRAEDMFQSYPILTNAKKIGYIAEPLYYYRWAPDSISNKCKADYYYAFRRIFLRENTYLAQWHVSNDIEETAFRNRVVSICSVIINCYKKSKAENKVDEWSKFLLDISEDDFFIHLMDRCDRKKTLRYYKILHYAVLAQKPRMAACLINVVSFLSEIKYKWTKR